MANIKKAMTHGGKFHADDVFSAALLKIIYPGIQIQRVFVVPEEFDGIVFDIGRGPFDHHQEDAEVRENGVPYAAFGLLWRKYGPLLVGKEEAVHFDEGFIQPLDADDNTGCGNQLASAISSFNPVWDSSENPDDCFARAVEFAIVILENKMERMRSMVRAIKIVQTALNKTEGKVVVLPQFAPWKTVLVPSKAEFVVYPSQRGGYSAQGVPKAMDTNELKHPFPVEWYGKPPEELQRISGIPTLNFCHKSGFLISADTLEDILQACRTQ